MWYFVVGSIIAFVLSIFMILMDYKARKTNSKVSNDPFATIAVGIGLLGVIILWPLVIIASSLVIYEIVDDLIRRYKFKKFMKRMKLITLLILLLGLTSCKSDRIDHTDCNYIYVWKYDISGDSALYKYQQPRIIERKVMGGRMKHKRIKVDLDNNGMYYTVRVPYGMNRSDIVRQAQKAYQDGKPLIGIFREKFYPYHEIEFIKYK